MSIYIHPSNQELLWSTMMKVPQFKQQYTDHPNHIVMWFRNVIGMFYDTYRDHPLKVQDLQKLNRETVAYMVQSLYKNAVELSSTPSTYQSYSSGTMYLPVNPMDTFENKTVTRNYMVEQRQAEFTHQLKRPDITDVRTNSNIYQFSERQKEYDQMRKGPVVQEIDFRMVELDQPIENMEELVQQHMKSREEIVQFAVPPPNSDNVNSDNTQNIKTVHWSPTVIATNEVKPATMKPEFTVETTSTSILDPAAVVSFMAETRQFMEQTRQFMEQTQSFPGRPTYMGPDRVHVSKRSSSF